VNEGGPEAAREIGDMDEAGWLACTDPVPMLDFLLGASSQATAAAGPVVTKKTGVAKKVVSLR
jgi:hypothetical protein